LQGGVTFPQKKRKMSLSRNGKKKKDDMPGIELNAGWKKRAGEEPARGKRLILEDDERGERAAELLVKGQK